MAWACVAKRRWRAPDQEVDQRGCGERLCKKIAKHVIWTGRMLWIVVDKHWMMIRMAGGSMFLLVPAHPGSPWQRAVKRLLLLVVRHVDRSTRSNMQLQVLTCCWSWRRRSVLATHTLHTVCQTAFSSSWPFTSEPLTFDPVTFDLGRRGRVRRLTSVCRASSLRWMFYATSWNNMSLIV